MTLLFNYPSIYLYTAEALTSDSKLKMGSASQPVKLTVLHFNDVYNIEPGSQVCWLFVMIIFQKIAMKFLAFAIYDDFILE